MIVIRRTPAEIPAVIAEQLRGASARAMPLFVFSSDVAADTWSEWAVCNPTLSGAEAVALESFVAWDTFKGTYLAERAHGKVCIPALLRKLFLRDLLYRNLQERFITKIILANDAESAYAFTDWLSKILPSLKLWHETYTTYLAARGMTATDDTDAENRDYETLYTRYNAFLTENGFFEPSWLSPTLVERERNVVIFYPELLEDFGDYEAVLADAEHVTAVELPQSDGDDARPRAYRYPDSRTELRRTLLQLRALHASGVHWTDIAVSVPDIDTYRPYLKREFARYCVPLNLRAGEPLTKRSAGLVFSQMRDCHTSRFSYDSVRALLQNEYIPWKADVAAVKERLLREGSRLRAICSYETDERSAAAVDSWLEALSAVPGDVRELALYRALKAEVTRICNARSFRALRTAWLTFRDRFLDVSNFTSEANRVLGRCISELNDIVDVEDLHVVPLGLTVENPFNFFLNELESKTYRPQEPLDGVSVFPYKLSAAAHFAHQFVIDASQTRLEVPYRKLGFLSDQKRRVLLGGNDGRTDASAAFVRLYAKDGDGEHSYFSYAEESFSGFAIAHNALSVADDKTPLAPLDAADFLKAEREQPLSERPITQQQQQAFLRWAARTRGYEQLQPYSASAALHTLVTDALVTRRHGDGNPVLTQTDLSRFYPCPRKWVLSTMLRLREDTLDTRLMQTYDMGNVNHKVLELFMHSLARRGEALPVTNADGVFDNETEIRRQLVPLAAEAVHDHSMDFRDSPVVLRALESQQEAIADGILDFLHYLCQPPQKPRTPGHNTSIKGFGGYKVQGAELEVAAVHAATGRHLFGKIDCLLSSDDDNFVIIDYKNSPAALPAASSLIADENELLADFQMPMYVTLLRDGRMKQGTTVQVEAAYFYAVRGRKRLSAIDEYKGQSKAQTEAGIKNPQQYEVFCKNTVGLFDTYVADFARRIGNGDFEPVNPQEKRGALVHVEPHAVCTGCSYQSICRTTFTVGARELSKAQ